ncbi:MAG TPA: AAA family ATPase [Dehalococcoidia bacterium]|nr:AAA family ATPase [Dehalococcoidia bacterium]
MADILILTGPPGSGKSAVAEALGERYDRVAHVEVEVLRRFITPTGFAKPHHPEREHQYRLGIRNACAIARNFIEERFGVIIDDIVPDASALELYLEGLKPAGVPVHFVRLMPSLEVCLERDRQRKEWRAPPGRVEKVYREMEAAGPFAGVTIDSSQQSVQETADSVQAATTSGASIVWPPHA